jgi:predicted enzyme related to lactoylglutathione lyase
MEAVDVRGRFVWHELMTRDVSAARKFYSQLAGWKPQAWPLDPSYTVNHSEHGPQAGFLDIPADMPADMPAHWVTYIGTRDIDGTAAAAVRAGGSILKGPDDIQGAGRYAVLKDPQGAVFAILDPENSRAEPTGMPPVGSFSWHELATTDHEAAFAFYSGLFGWDALVRHDMGPMGIYLIFGTNGVQRGGMFIKPADNPGPPSWLPYISIPDADTTFASAMAAGAKTLVPPMTVPGGSRIAQLLDPTGAAIAVHSPGAAADAAAPAAEAKAPAAPRPKAPAKKKSAPAKKATAKKKKKSASTKKAAAKKKAAPKKKPAPRKKAAARKPAPKKKVMRKAARKKATVKRRPARRKAGGARRKK